MQPEMTIRPAGVDDAAEIQQVARRSWHRAYEKILDADRIDDIVDDWYAPKRLIEDDISRSDRRFFVATTGEEVVGFAEAVPSDSDDGVAELYRIYVQPDRWNRGIGQALLEHVQETLRERGFETLSLTVFAENTVGVRFYESKGFERVDTGSAEQFDAREYTYIKEL